MSESRYYAPMLVGGWDGIKPANSSIPIQFDDSCGAGFISVYLTREEALANCPEGTQILTFRVEGDAGEGPA